MVDRVTTVPRQYRNAYGVSWIGAFLKDCRFQNPDIPVISVDLRSHYRDMSPSIFHIAPNVKSQSLPTVSGQHWDVMYNTKPKYSSVGIVLALA